MKSKSLRRTVLFGLPLLLIGGSWLVVRGHRPTSPGSESAQTQPGSTNPVAQMNGQNTVSNPNAPAAESAPAGTSNSLNSATVAHTNPDMNPGAATPNAAMHPSTPTTTANMGTHVSPGTPIAKAPVTNEGSGIFSTAFLGSWIKSLTSGAPVKSPTESASRSVAATNPASSTTQTPGGTPTVNGGKSAGVPSLSQAGSQTGQVGRRSEICRSGRTRRRSRTRRLLHP